MPSRSAVFDVPSRMMAAEWTVSSSGAIFKWCYQTSTHDVQTINEPGRCLIPLPAMKMLLCFFACIEFEFHFCVNDGVDFWIWVLRSIWILQCFNVS